MVSNARDDLPEPLSQVSTTNWSLGISTLRFLRLFSLAPRILIKRFLSFASADMKPPTLSGHTKIFRYSSQQQNLPLLFCCKTSDFLSVYCQNIRSSRWKNRQIFLQQKIRHHSIAHMDSLSRKIYPVSFLFQHSDLQMFFQDLSVNVFHIFSEIFRKRFH